MSTIFLLGDSTCQTYEQDRFPQTGWGQVLSSFLSPGYEVRNLAMSGRSTKSFLDEGRFEPCEAEMKEGDYVFIQFGHNDEKKQDPTRYTEPFGSYQENLLFFVNEARKKKAIPVLISSIYRRHFVEGGKLEENCHLDYPKAMEELAKRENVLYIDLCKVTKEHIERMGVEPSKSLFMNFPAGMYPNFPDGQEDNTHLRPQGARFICGLLSDEMKKTPLKGIFL